ncbi:MAG: succinate dehydrogenase [Vulcanisaeta sp.]|nr:succinate dehydrogenase [Vulcanisaeta sp.]MCG2869702.1 succinate dehydrogenase [Vulcanisaeta sp.]
MGEKSTLKSGRGFGEWFRTLNRERVLAMLHKITGIYMVLWLFPRPWIVIASGHWSTLLVFDSTPIGKALAILFVVFFLFHGLNGLRIVLIELGIISGRPIRHPINPVPALRESRTHKWAILLIITIAIIGGIYAAYITIFGIAQISQLIPTR